MLLILLGLFFIALIDLLPMIRQRQWRGVAAFLLFFLPAVTLSVLWKNKVEVPSLLGMLDQGLRALGIGYH